MAADSISSLRARVRGEIVQPSDAAYDSVRKVYNGMIDKRPGLIVRCVDAADVMATVDFARDQGALVAIRGGGHNGAGLGTCEGGVVIDLSLMKGVHVDVDARTARVGGGCTWGDVDHATHAFGMAVPSGMISTTGVGGLTLGGGIGHLSRKYGLTIDNLLAVDAVLADGRFVTASEKENQDLFWAVRGGGGNFGVVTSFLFRARPVETVYAGPTFWPLDQAAEVMQRYRQFIVEAPEEVSGFFAFLVVPPAPMFPAHLHNRKMCGIVWCCTGPAGKAEKAIQPMLGFREPALSMVGSMPFPALQSMFDALYTPGMQWYWKADFVKELSDPAIALHVQHASRIPTMFSTMHLYPINGAVHRVMAGDTAFSCRDATWAEVIVGVDPDPANAGKIVDWTRNYWDALHPYSVGSAYVNFLMEEGQDRVRATYGENYNRLAAIKSKYDPTNFFRVNQNIQPAGYLTAG
jgi:FAD/FMN-containing dehydrogenase